MYSQESIDELKAKVSVLEVIEKHISLKQKGTSFIANCPFHKESTPSFYVTPAKGIYKCFGCGKSGTDAIQFIMDYKHIPYPDALRYLADEYNIVLEEEGNQVYTSPTWKNNTALSEPIVKWFEGRKISQKTLVTAKISEGVEYMPQLEKEVNTIQFNYFDKDELVNIKYRGPKKSFKLHKGAKLILYGLDTLIGKTEAFITEGEVDMLSLIESGYITETCGVVSVPNGASKDRNNLVYINNSWEQIKHIEKWHLGLDNDSNGRKLRDELSERFGKYKCDYIEWKDKKDANEVLISYGIQGIIDCCSHPVKFAMAGAYTISDFAYEIEDMRSNGLDKGVSIGLKDFPVRFVKGYLAIWTGVSAMGKSEAVDEVCMRLLNRHKWKIAYYSPENKPTQLHYSKLASKLVGKSWDSMTKEEDVQCRNYLENNVFFIKPKKDFSLDSVLESIREVQERHGLDCFVIDAWYNIELEHDDTKGIAQALNKIALFCEKNNLLCHLVAHSVKPEEDKKTGKLKVPKLYNISGSNNFHNKADYGFSVHIDEGIAYFHVLKRKFKHWGWIASPGYKYDENSGRYYKEGFPDFTNWITGKVNTKPVNPNELPLEENIIIHTDNEEEPF